MPVITGTDSKGCYSRWGGHGKKYYYKCGDKAARERAKRKAGKQGQAAHARGYKGSLLYSTGFQGNIPTVGGDKHVQTSKSK